MSSRPFVRFIKIEFGHCDPLQIVYYPNYAIWCDQSTHHIFEAAGLPLRKLQSDMRFQVPLVDLSVQFQAPASWGDEIEIASHVSRWGTKSFDVSHTISLRTGKNRIARMRETRVCVEADPADPKKIFGRPVPKEVKAAFEAAGLSCVGS